MSIGYDARMVMLELKSTVAPGTYLGSDTVIFMKSMSSRVSTVRGTNVTETVIVCVSSSPLKAQKSIVG